MKRLSKVRIRWSPEFAYAIGLIATDGSLSIDKRHINFTSKDGDLVELFKKCFKLHNKIGKKVRGTEKERRYFQVQFGDKNFYEFLLSIGLTHAKSKTIGCLDIIDDYFADFLRGCIDGDGSIGVFKHPESRYPQLRTRLYSASASFLEWIKEKTLDRAGIKTGWIEKSNDISVLVYAKEDSIRLLNYIYYPNVEYYLKRKYNIAKPFLRV